ncbi:helicase associated domain-containing protein [Nakamurella alba]|uniref:helicase associated domain-containing protein n=1 Tax=Nakamurella alba TaxID=2665158 RepID=UPI0012B929BA
MGRGRQFKRDDGRWSAHLADVSQFCEDQGHFPRSTYSADASERPLGQWLAQQRRELTACSLTTRRLEQLDRTLPGWASTIRGAKKPMSWPAPHPPSDPHGAS